ncbi:MAG TPA: hypothetical protein VGH91_05340 [Gammaproteobacteria bacterium]|jgi:hypothetical protein
MKQDEKTELWITIGNQPGCGAWFSVWLVSHYKKVHTPKVAAKKLPRVACTA